jgi:hypothetical protein
MGHTTNVSPEKAPPAVVSQAHNQFKVFIPKAGISYDAAMKENGDQVAAWSKTGEVHPKSVSIEYIESKKQLVLSVGYVRATAKEPGYSVYLQVVSIGNHPELRADRLEDVMRQAAVGVPNVICHEFFVTDEGEFVMVFLAHG